MYIFIESILITYIISLIVIPLLNKLNCKQNVSRSLERHLNKDGTPTMGGFIFIIPFIILSIIYKINILLIIPSLLYALLGFIDDYIKIIKGNNKGLSIMNKFLLELLIAIIFYFLYRYYGNSNELCIFNKCFDINFIYGIWILCMLVGFTNAVNITDGLDGLCTGLSFILLIGFLFIINHKEYSILILLGSLIIFLKYNFFPAKVFMGDLGSLFLGSFMVCISFLIKKEYLLIIMGSVFILEILSSFIQVISIKFFNKKIFLKAPLHHHFEELNIPERNIVLYYYTIGILMVIIGIIINIYII